MARITISRSAKNICIALGVALLVGLIAWLVVSAMNRPSHSDFEALQNKEVKNVVDATKEIKPAYNEYVRAFMQSLIETKAVDKAELSAKKQKTKLNDTVAATHKAVATLRKSKAANDQTVGTEVDNFTQATEQYAHYYRTLADSHDEFTALFDAKENICYDIFVGKTDDFAQRQSKLKAAVKDCYPALSQLKKSGNVSYYEYAQAIENRIKKLEKITEAVVKGEADYKRFEAEHKKLQQELDAAGKSASSDKYNQLLEQVKTLNEKMKQSRTDFEAAATSYPHVTKEITKLYETQYNEVVPKQTELLNSLIEARYKTLSAVVEDKLLDE